MKSVMIFRKSISITKFYIAIKNQIKIFLICLFYLFFFISFSKEVNALEENLGKHIFENHCAGCHINGGNIIRRSKNLKISSLKHNGIDNSEAIAKIARQGIGIMDGYKDQLDNNGDQIVANWIWEQAQKAWVQE